MVEILSPVAHVLVEQVIEGKTHAAPCFEFYSSDPQGKALSPKGLYDGLAAEVDRAYQLAAGDTKEAIGKIAFCLKALAPAV